MPWFGLPKRTEYILRSLSCLARSNSPLPVRTIATCERIPASFLAKILYQLTWYGLVNSKRGPGGGFTLARPPEQIPVKQVLEIFQVPPGNRSEASQGYDFSQAWEKLWEPTRHALERLTLADLLHIDLSPAGHKGDTALETRSPHAAPRAAARGRTRAVP